MPLQPTNSAPAWPEPRTAGAGLDTIEAGYRKDTNGDWYPTIETPFQGKVLDISGTGNYVLTDITGGIPVFVSELKLMCVAGHFITYL